MMTPVLVILTATALVGFAPNLRIDHENMSDRGCTRSAITVGPWNGVTQPLYVAIEDESLWSGFRSDIIFQKSTDAGVTWLNEDLLVRRGELQAVYPDIATDLAGDIYISFTEVTSMEGKGHVYCTRSTDEGKTWSEPVQIDDNDTIVTVGWVRIVADSAGKLLAAWNQELGDRKFHILSSVSIDHGATWRPKVRLDTTNRDCYHADVAIQPGSNCYLVAALCEPHTYLFRSSDEGATFEPGMQMDTFHSGVAQPHVVAAREHVICDFNAQRDSGGEITQARTFFSGPDTWGNPVEVTHIDSGFRSYCNGGALALSTDGAVHTALMIFDPARGFDVCYTTSTDDGASWSERTRVNDTTTIIDNPDIAADSAGAVYVIWQDTRNRRNEIWFSTYNPTGVTEQSGRRPEARTSATVVRWLPPGAAAFDVMGRRVLYPEPGVCFLRTATSSALQKALLVK